MNSQDAGRIFQVFRCFLADQRGFLRLYRSPDGDDGGGGGGDDQPGADDTATSTVDPKLVAARDDAAKQRIKARDANDANKKLTADLDASKKQQAAILKAAGMEPNDDGSADIEAFQKQQRDKERDDTAKSALARARFETQAVKSGAFDPDAIEDVYVLAESKGFLDGVDVDLNTSTVSGIEEAVQKAEEAMPHLKAMPQDDDTPRRDNRPPGDPHRPTINLADVMPGDIRKMPDDDFYELLEGGIDLKMGRVDGNGNELVLKFRDSDSATSDILRHTKRYEERRDARFGRS